MAVIQVATANTEMGKAFVHPNGLAPIYEADVWLLQEVDTRRDDQMMRVIGEAGMKLALEADEFGLAIAVKHGITFEDTSKTVLQPRTTIGKIPGLNEQRLRARGLVSAHLTHGEISCAVVTTHPTIPLRSAARTAQLCKIPQALSSISGPLIVGGDMNHFPGPRRADRRMQQEAALARVDIGGQPTWHSYKSKQRVISSLAGRLAGRQSTSFGYSAQLDSLYYRGGFSCTDAQVVEIRSDHCAIIASFET